MTAARALAAETLTLGRTVSDLVNQAHALTPAEIEHGGFQRGVSLPATAAAGAESAGRLF